MDWKQRLLSHAAALGRASYEDAAGVGIEFGDGCDVFWVLPGEVTSTVPVPVAGPQSVEPLLSEYEEIDRLRERALHVVRHYLASRDVRIDRRRSGTWPVELSSRASTTLSVGAYLTAVARDTRDVYAAVDAVIRHSWVGKVPSRRRIDRYLNTAGDPPNERPIGEGRE